MVRISFTIERLCTNRAIFLVPHPPELYSRTRTLSLCTNTLMAPGDSYPTQAPWTMYAHTAASPNTYTSSYVKLGTVASFEDWGRLWNHCHPQLVGSPHQMVVIKKAVVTSWSFFRSNILPEWEDPHNHDGITLSHRSVLPAESSFAIWESLVTSCVLGAQPSTVTGIFVTRKGRYVRGHEYGVMMKFEVWLREGADTSEVRHWLNVISIPLTFSHCARNINAPLVR